MHEVPRHGLSGLAFREVRRVDRGSWWVVPLVDGLSGVGDCIEEFFLEVSECVASVIRL